MCLVCNAVVDLSFNTKKIFFFGYVIQSLPMIKQLLSVFFVLGDSPGESPKRKNTTFRTRRKFEIRGLITCVTELEGFIK